MHKSEPKKEESEEDGQPNNNSGGKKGGMLLQMVAAGELKFWQVYKRSLGFGGVVLDVLDI